MKKTDWAMVVLVVVVVAVASWFIVGAVLPAQTDETVKIAPPITTEIQAPENNIILYDADRPSWCPKDNTAAGDEGSPNPDGGATENTDGKQFINAAFNSCAINSSFTTTTE